MDSTKMVCKKYVLTVIKLVMLFSMLGIILSGIYLGAAGTSWTDLTIPMVVIFYVCVAVAIIFTVIFIVTCKCFDPRDYAYRVPSNAIFTV